MLSQLCSIHFCWCPIPSHAAGSQLLGAVLYLQSQDPLGIFAVANTPLLPMPPSWISSSASWPVLRPFKHIIQRIQTVCVWFRICFLQQRALYKLIHLTKGKTTQQGQLMFSSSIKGCNWWWDSRSQKGWESVSSLIMLICNASIVCSGKPKGTIITIFL